MYEQIIAAPFEAKSVGTLKTSAASYIHPTVNTAKLRGRQK